MPLTREKILKADDLALEKLDVPEWGGDVYVRTLSGVERDAFEESIVKGKGNGKLGNLHNLRARLAVKCVVDKDGKRLFGDRDAAALGEKSAAVLDRIFDVARKLNRFRDEDIEEAAGN